MARSSHLSITRPGDGPSPRGRGLAFNQHDSGNSNPSGSGERARNWPGELPGLGEDLFGDVEVRVDGLNVLVVLERLDQDRKSTRLNSSHVKISYAVFCLKKK